MIGLLWNLLLATCWMFLTGSFEVLNYAFGFFVGYLVLVLVHGHVSTLENYPRKLPRLIIFLCYFFRELVISNFKVAIDIVTPPWHMQPGVIGFKTHTKNDLELTILANLISLTPGTLVLDVSEDKTTLFVHAMFLEDASEVDEGLRDLEKRLLQFLR